MRLGQTKRTEQFALCQARQPFLLLGVIAVTHQDGVDGAVGDTDGGADTAIARRNFFQHQTQGDIVQIGAAQRLWHANTVGTQCGQTFVRCFGKLMRLVPCGRVGPELFFGKSANCIAHHFLIGIQNHVALSCGALSLPGQSLAVVI